jgi:hypothetical protein
VSVQTEAQKNRPPNSSVTPPPTLVDSKLPKYLFPGRKEDEQFALFTQKLELIDADLVTAVEKDAIIVDVKCGTEACRTCASIFHPIDSSASILLENIFTGELRRVPASAEREYMKSVWSPWRVADSRGKKLTM